MIRIDGSEKSGSGTILRYALALSSLLGEELEMINIRASRKKPGLRPQHLRSVIACCEMTDGEVDGAAVDSTRIRYRPGPGSEKTRYIWDIGTAGSTTMLAFSILPLAIFSSRSLHFKISGGLFQDFAPGAFHMERILLPLLERMGPKANLKIARPGYVPKGGGIIELSTHPVKGKLAPLGLREQGRVSHVRGVSLASHLSSQEVSKRMAERCRTVLSRGGLEARFEMVDDKSAPQRGAALFVRAESDTGCLIGADQAGRVGRRSEAIGTFVGRCLLEDLETGATVDRHLADQLILFAGLASGTTTYRIPRLTDHVETNLWLIETILDAQTSIEDNRVMIEGIGYEKQ
ncbi:MAG: RNA 3'-phosphate cyclase [Proteobacteria bacterium]|nr:RNA 3'-phosphate cyclase [Pseudomonadota bacterium]